MTSENIQPCMPVSRSQDTTNQSISISNKKKMMAFIPTKTWLGEKKGFYFGTGFDGTGYYIDSLKQKDMQTTRKKKESENRRRPK